MDWPDAQPQSGIEQWEAFLHFQGSEAGFPEPVMPVCTTHG